MQTTISFPIIRRSRRITTNTRVNYKCDDCEDEEDGSRQDDRERTAKSDTNRRRRRKRTKDDDEGAYDDGIDNDDDNDDIGDEENTPSNTPRKRRPRTRVRKLPPQRDGSQSTAATPVARVAPIMEAASPVQEFLGRHGLLIDTSEEEEEYKRSLKLTRRRRGTSSTTMRPSLDNNATWGPSRESRDENPLLFYNSDKEDDDEGMMMTMTTMTKTEAKMTTTKVRRIQRRRRRHDDPPPCAYSLTQTAMLLLFHAEQSKKILKQAGCYSDFTSPFARQLKEDPVTKNRVVYALNLDEKVGYASNYLTRKKFNDEKAISEGMPKPTSHVVVDFDKIPEEPYAHLERLYTKMTSTMSTATELHPFQRFFLVLL
eukprot:scaffold4869_cov183-Amphora_coffeaeformis.AAC.8